MAIDPTQRRCPRDGATLAKKADTFVTLDACPSCEGSFYERGEAETALSAGADVELLVKSGAATRLERAGGPCPACSAAMQTVRVAAHLATASAELDAPADFRRADATFEIDTCPACGGLWLDAGEETKLMQVGRESRTSLIEERDAVDHRRASRRGWTLIRELFGIKSA